MSPTQRTHHDPGLQPERTALAWSRTMFTLCVAAAVFLRWAPTHGLFVLVLFGLSVSTALGIYATQRRRYGRVSMSIAREHGTPGTAAVLVTSAAVTSLGLLGLVVVIAF